MAPSEPSLWDYVERGVAAGARTIHLHPGAQPLIRLPIGDLQPLGPDDPELDARMIMSILVRVVDPDRWDQLDQTGQGEITLNPAAIGRPIRISLYRAREQWSAVVFI